MGPADVVIGLVVLAVFLLCVRSIVRSNRNGECADCSINGSCEAHDTGHCEISEDMVAKAAAAADAYAAAHSTGK